MKKTDKIEQDFVQTLYAIEAAGITDVNAFYLPEHEQLYHRLWLHTEAFVNHCALRSKDRVDKTGKKKPGNQSRMEFLAEQGASVEDIREDILVHIMRKLPLVLKRPVEQQKAYIYTIVNHCVVDALRSLPPVGSVSMDETVKTKRVSSDDACCYHSLVGHRVTPALELEAKEAVRQRAQTRQRQREKEGAALLEDVAYLADSPEQALVHLSCCYLGMKPRQVTQVLLRFDAQQTYDGLIAYLERKHGMALREMTGAYRICRDKLKLDTADPKLISAEISRLKNRAKGKLKVLEKDR